MANVKSYTTILYGGRALDVVGDTTVDKGYPELKPVLSHSVGNKPNLHSAVDLSTGSGKASFKVVGTQDMEDLIEEIKIKNLKGVKEPLTCIDSAGKTDVFMNAFLTSKYEQTYSPDGSISVEFAFEGKDY
jgi:hypothetical protein